MDESEFEGTIVLEKLARIDRVEEFMAAVDSENAEVATQLMKAAGIDAFFHYVPLHSSPMGKKFGYKDGNLPITEQLSGRLLRLPLYYDLTEIEQVRVVNCIKEFLEKILKPVSVLSDNERGFGSR